MKAQIFINFIAFYLTNCANSANSGAVKQTVQNYLDASGLTPNTGCTYNKICTEEFIEDAAILTVAAVSANLTIPIINNVGPIKSLSLTYPPNYQLTLYQNVCSTLAPDNSSERNTFQAKIDNFRMNLEVADITPTASVTFVTDLLSNTAAVLKNVCPTPSNPTATLTSSLPNPIVDPSCLLTMNSLTALSAVFSTVLKNVIVAFDFTSHRNGTWTSNYIGLVNESSVQFYDTKCTPSNFLCNCIMTGQIMRQVLISLGNVLIPCLIQNYVNENPDINLLTCPLN